jgi:type IV secretion system protein VirB4
MIPLVESAPAKARLAQTEIPIRDFIPYASLYNDETVLTKSGQLIQILRLDGFAFECADADDIELRNKLRNVLLKSVAGNDYALWFHTIRRRQPAYPGGDFDSGFAQDLNKRWKEKYRSRHLFENNLYISIVRRGTRTGWSGIHHLFQRLSHQEDKVQQRAALEAACQDLTDITRRFESALADYGPHVLSAEPTPGGRLSEPLAFLARLINFEGRPILAPTMDLSRYLAYKRLFFGENAIECRGTRGSRYAALVSIKEYAPQSSAGLLDGFFHLPFEFVLTQSFVYKHRQEALGRMQMQQRRMQQAGDLAVSQTEEIDQALDDAMAGAMAFGDHHLTLQPMVDSLDELEEAVARIETELMNVGILGVREDLNMEACFWAQLPANFQYIARRSTIHTANVAGFASLHNYPSGRPDGNHWGPAVTVLETQGGTPYFFNFHAGDVGHTTLIGPTGAGKTALLNFFCAQARKFNARLFYFDRDRGSEIFLRALGGHYSILGASRPSGFNPLQLPDSPENRAFLVDWLKALLSSFGDSLSNEDVNRITEAVSGNYRLAWNHRTLANVAPFLGMEGPGRLSSRLAFWYGSGAKSQLFGNSKDALSLDHRVMGFDMGEILGDPQCLAPILSYLFHRIAATLTGVPTMIVLEEAWALFKHPLMASKIEDWLKTFRKLNAILIFATQSVEDALRSSISPTLISQTATHIYFPNPKATEEYRSAFRLSEKELHLIREGLDKENRHFLLKQGRDSVVARADFGDMQNFLSVLSGRAETVRHLDQLRAEMGDDPAIWLPRFLEDSNESTRGR